MNALSLYLTTCQMILQSNSEDCVAWVDICRMLSHLRKSLSCHICGNLLMVPMTSNNFTCQHYVCKSCIAGKMNISCTTCQTNKTFVESTQIRILLQCYKKLCEYVISMSLHRRWGYLNSGSNGTLRFSDILQEGANFNDNYKFCSLRPRDLTKTGVEQAVSLAMLTSGDINSIKVAVPPNCTTPETNSNTKNSELLNGDVKELKATSNNSVKMCNNSASELPKLRKSPQNSYGATKKIVKSPVKMKPASPQNNYKEKSFGAKRKGCRCGMATPNPGQLTCCGQRCPCYVDGKPCFGCRCRGCRNPSKKFIQARTDFEDQKNSVPFNIKTEMCDLI